MRRAMLCLSLLGLFLSAEAIATEIPGRAGEPAGGRAGTPVTELKNVTPAVASKLIGAGIKTVQILANASLPAVQLAVGFQLAPTLISEAKQFVAIPTK